MMFFLGLFIGGILGMFLTAILTVGKMSDLEDELIREKEKLKFRMYGGGER